MKQIYIGDYRLLARLGRDSLTEVFLAVRRQATSLADLVVVKRPWLDDPAGSDPNKFQASLVHEARLASRLQHRNIAQTYEVAVDDTPFLAMEYLDGQHFDRILSTSSNASGLPVELAVQVVNDLLLALDYAHTLTDDDSAGLGIVHGDVNPHNIFVTYRGEVKLLDFVSIKHALGLNPVDRRIAHENPIYMAPEQVLGMTVDGRVDLFAVGVVMWECLAMRPLFTADTAVAARDKLLYEPVPQLSAIRPNLAPALIAICDRALDRDPERRYPTASAMLLDLENLCGASADRSALASFIQRRFEEDRQARARSIEQIENAEGAFNPAATITLEATADQSAAIEPERLALPLTEPPPSLLPPPPTRNRALRVAALLCAMFALVVALVWTRSSTPGTASAASAHPMSTGTEAPAAAADVVLRLCGSNTIGAELAPALIEAMLVTKGCDAVVRRHDATSGLTTVHASLSGKPIDVEISARGSATAFSGLAEGTCDVGMASRAIDDTEVSRLLARGYGDLRSRGSEHVIALDGIAMIVHPNNPLRTLDRAALHDIYTGKTNNWSTLGGSPGPITVFARDSKSGTFDTFKHLVLGKDELASNARRFAENAALADAVASDPSAIGFVGLAYIRTAKALAVGEPGATPMLPTQFTVATEGYMLSRRLYFYTLPTPRTPWVTELIIFATSQRAQEVAAENQFVDLRLLTEVAHSDAKSPPLYASTVAKAARVSVDFRFRAGSNELDSRADRDIERLIGFMQDHRDSKVLLLGFSDVVGSPIANAKLSLARAKTIEHELAMRGVHAAVVRGFGADMPVASNDTDGGRQRNRRVEAWIER